MIGINRNRRADEIAPLLQDPRPQPDEPFVWGSGGERMSPQEVAMRRKMGMSRLGGVDYSPIGHWTQGLARVGQGILGGLDMAEARKGREANEAADAELRAALTGGEVTDDMIAAALMDPAASEGTRGYAAMLMKARQPAKPGKPHYWETNDGSLGMVDPVTGQPTILYQDPNAKMNFIPDGMGGGQWVAVPNSARGGDQTSGVSSTAAPPAVGDIVDGYRFKGGDTKDPNNWEEVGGQASAPDPFRQPV